MGNDQFNIYIEQLRNGREKILNEVLDPSFLDIHEAELSCETAVTIEGKAYLAEEELIIHFDALKTMVIMPCSICNESVSVPIELHDVYHGEPLAKITSGIYSFKEMLRETLLLEVPHFTECEGSCPMRKEIAPYLKKESSTHASSTEEGHQPFAHFDFQLDNKAKKEKKNKQ